MKKYDTRQRDYLISFLNEHPDQLLSVRQIAQELCAQQISSVPSTGICPSWRRRADP